MNVVIDASVSLKWFIPDDGLEQDAEIAIDLFKQIQLSNISLVQPVHWQAEVVAVLARIQTKNYKQSIQLLDILEFPVCDNLEIYQLASEIAIKLNHHLFDTLYHAVALNRQALLITADKKYYARAKEFGNIILLTDYQC